MPAPIALVAFALATWPSDLAGDNLERITRAFNTAEAAMYKVEEGTAKPEKVAVVLGKLLGESRSHESEVSAALVDTRLVANKQGVKVVAWSGTLEAYLSCAVLGLDGDDASLSLSRILGARLRREIDRRKQ